jgi:chaperonin cofactor prefoldin
MNAIQNLEAEIQSQLTAIDVSNQYDEMLDECYSFDSVGGIFANMQPSRVLRECDEVAYRCGKSDWLDGMSDQWVEINGNYYDADKAQNIKDQVVTEAEDRVSALEGEIEELEREEESDTDEIDAKKSELSDANAEVQALNNHSF